MTFVSFPPSFIRIWNHLEKYMNVETDQRFVHESTNISMFKVHYIDTFYHKEGFVETLLIDQANLIWIRDISKDISDYMLWTWWMQTIPALYELWITIIWDDGGKWQSCWNNPTFLFITGREIKCFYHGNHGCRRLDCLLSRAYYLTTLHLHNSKFKKSGVHFHSRYGIWYFWTIVSLIVDSSTQQMGMEFP